MTKSLIVPSPAKVNLFLEVLRKRPDGYHEIETVFQEVDLCDEIRVELMDGNHIMISSDSPHIPVDATNLAYRAAQKVLELAGLDIGLKIHITKRIPVAAGLGGGSSNAASVIKALQRLLNLEVDPDKVFQLAKSLGADVPFFLFGGTAIGRGMGEVLEPLTNLKPFSLLMVNPKFQVSTAEVYQSLNLSLTSKNSDISLVAKAIAHGDIKLLGSSLYNRLEEVVLNKFPELQKIKETLLRSGVDGALLSGSGPTLYAITEHEEDALKVQEQVKLMGLQNCWTCVCRTV